MWWFGGGVGVEFTTTLIDVRLLPYYLPFIVVDAAHCADMYPARPEEPSVLPAVRKQIYELLTKWLQL